MLGDVPVLPLSGISAIELGTGVAAAYCGRLFAGWGADVIKVEPRQGDPIRRMLPTGRVPIIEGGAFHLYLNQGKESMTLELGSTTARDILARLLNGANVLIQSSDRSLWHAGITIEEAREWNPRLIVVTISDFGSQGPYSAFRGSTLVDFAMSGLMYITGEPEREPLLVGGEIPQYAAGQVAFYGALVALYESESSGEGEDIDVSVVEANAALEEFSVGLFEASGVVDVRKGNRHARHPWGIYPCRDGFVGIIGGPERAWPEMGRLVDERLSEPRFADPASRETPEARDEIDAILLPWLLERNKVEIFHTGQRHGLAFSYVASPSDVLGNEHLQARGFFASVNHPAVAEAVYPRAPVILHGADWRPARAPCLGEHNHRILTRLGYSDVEVVQLWQGGII